MKKNGFTRILLVLLTGISLFFLLPCAALAADTDALYDESGIEDAFDVLDEQTLSLLESLGLDISDPASLLAITPARVVAAALSLFTGGLTEPMQKCAIIMGAVLLFALLDSAAPSVGKSSDTGGMLLMLMLSLLVIAPVSDCVSNVLSAIRVLSGFTRMLIPILASFVAASGKPLLSASFSAASLGAAEAVSWAVDTFFVPLVGAYAAICVVAAVNPVFNLQNIALFFRRIFTVVLGVISSLFADPKLKDTFDEIIKKAQAAARVRIAARQAKEVARAKNSIDNLTLVGKLSACTGKKPELNELFIVEGDSAGGTAKQARVRQYQSILPLRGKPLNVEKKRLDQVLANEEIRTIISALGAGYGSDFNMDDLKYHKVIILSDADQDGLHIRCILLTFFFRYMRELINNGNVYIGMPPLYKVYKKDVVEYAYDDNELQKKIEIVGKGYQIQRYKGLGEMSADQLWETTMDPARRNLIRVNIEDAAEAEQMVTALMGDRVEARKEFLAQNANFNKIDTFIDRVNI